MYLMLGAVALDWFPSWSLPVGIPILLVRWILLVHDLFHLRRTREVNWLIQLLPILTTPLALGYREYQEIHSGHHQLMATPSDPEYYQICGSPLKGFLNALTSPEQTFFRWIAHRGMNQDLLRESVIRLCWFGAIASLSGQAFLWYWIPLRLAYGISYFIFFYCLHRRGKEYGVYSLDLPKWLQFSLQLLFGREALLEICYHDVHHAHPQVAPQYLPIVGK
jgi:fatty acid desaturase